MFFLWILSTVSFILAKHEFYLTHCECSNPREWIKPWAWLWENEKNLRAKYRRAETKRNSHPISFLLHFGFEMRVWDCCEMLWLGGFARLIKGVVNLALPIQLFHQILNDNDYFVTKLKGWGSIWHRRNVKDQFNIRAKGWEPNT